MPQYHAFDGILRSQLTLPALAPAEGGPVRWDLRILPDPRPLPDSTVLGSEEVEPGVRVALLQHEGGLRLAFDDTGTFDIASDGATIEWAAPDGVDLDAARKDVLGRVLAVALQQQGVIALHGSAVSLGGLGICFLAPKFHGKSTTAAALVDAGARFLTDDLVAVEGADPPRVLPGVPVFQLWRDSAERVAAGASDVPGEGSDAKRQRFWRGAVSDRGAGARLGAVYLLAPRPADPAAKISRSRLSVVEAALALLGQAKLIQLLGTARRVELLAATSRLAERVPVYRLAVPRDFARLGDLVSSLQGWHGGAAA